MFSISSLKKYFKDKKNREKILPISIIFSIFILIILGLVLMCTFDYKKVNKTHYEERSNLDYQVYLKENQFYDTPYLPKDKKYISALIKYIDSYFSYNFKSEENLNLKYDYYIDAVLKINDTTGDNILEKKYAILDKKEVTGVSSSFGISENVKIDYDKYNNIAKQFVNQYNINGKAVLEVSLHVDILGEHENFSNSISDKGVVKLNVPLLEDVNSIEMDYDLVNNKDAILEYSSTKIRNIPLFLTILLLMISDIILTIVIVYKIIKDRDASTLYEMRLNKIKKEYDGYLIETVAADRLDELYKTRSLRVILVKKFDDLLDARDTLKKPILYNEEIPGKETIFYIIADNIAYLYVMHVNGFEKSEVKYLKSSKQKKNTKKAATSKEKNSSKNNKVDKFRVID